MHRDTQEHTYTNMDTHRDTAGPVATWTDVWTQMLMLRHGLSFVWYWVFKGHS